MGILGGVPRSAGTALLDSAAFFDKSYGGQWSGLAKN